MLTITSQAFLCFATDVCIFVCYQTQEKEALDHMRRKAKEIQQRNREMAKGGRMPGMGSGGGGFGSNSFRSDTSMIETSSMEPPKPSYSKPVWVQCRCWAYSQSPSFAVVGEHVQSRSSCCLLFLYSQQNVVVARMLTYNSRQVSNFKKKILCTFWSREITLPWWFLEERQ